MPVPAWTVSRESLKHSPGSRKRRSKVVPAREPNRGCPENTELRPLGWWEKSSYKVFWVPLLKVFIPLSYDNTWNPLSSHLPGLCCHKHAGFCLILSNLWLSQITPYSTFVLLLNLIVNYSRVASNNHATCREVFCLEIHPVHSFYAQPCTVSRAWADSCELFTMKEKA